MNSIEIKPYESIEDQNFMDYSVFFIKKKDFEGIQYDGSTITFSFIACNFQNLEIISKEEVEFDSIFLNFYGCYIDELLINQITSSNIAVSFSSCILSGKIESSILQSTTFNNCIIKSSIFLISLNSISVTFTQENVFTKVWQKPVRKLSYKNLEDILKLKQTYYISGSKKIFISSNELNDGKTGIHVNKHQKGTYSYKNLYLNKSQKQLVNVGINEYSAEIKDEDTKIIGSLLRALSFSGYSRGRISVENCIIDNLYIRNFSTEGEVNFYNIGPLNSRAIESKLEIHKSNLDKTWFDNIYFSEYKVLSFFRTRFGKSTFTSCDFPSDYTSFEKFKTLENIHYPDKRPSNYYKNQYEIFLQLKIQLEATGNFYEAQKLQAISNDALKKIDQISKWDRFILWVNSKSNNHGLSIVQPLRLFLFTSIVFYVLYLYSLDRIFNGNSIDFLLIGYFFTFIDITHRVDFLVDKNEFNAYSLIIDFISKILLGFFIYQFIAAFRKYGKK